MSVTRLDFLFRVEAPYVFLGAGEEGREKWNPGHFYSAQGLDSCVRRLRGNKMRTTGELMTEFGAVLQLFEGFGENWYALEECLSYLDEWLPAEAYVLVVDRAEEVLADEPTDLAAFLKTIDAAGEFWSKPVEGNGRFDRGPVAFHVLLNLSGADESLEAESRIRYAAAEAGVRLRDG
jgi:Barstar (barnase inhibitor)